MDKLDDAKKILFMLGMPSKQQSDLCAYTLVALAGLKTNMKWQQASQNWFGIHEIMQFLKINYGIAYAENSRETFRKQAMHHFRNAAIVEDNGCATNSPHYKYRLTNEFLALVQTFKGDKWQEFLETFLNSHTRLVDLYAQRKQANNIFAMVNSQLVQFSSGKHNQLQKAILEDFTAYFAKDAVCLYVGDTINKDLVKDSLKLQELGFDISLHDKMPDVVLWSEAKQWLYFIEAVTSVGPMEPKRVLELNELTKKVICGKIYITAFLDFKTYKKFSQDLAWDSEVWIAELPSHMIHLNGDKFLGPRQ